MWEYTHTDELYHHGVKGMKWGVRRTAAQLGHYVKSKRTAKKRKDALAKARATREKNRVEAEKRKKKIERGKLSSKQMTEAELNARIERLNLEKRYNDLMRENKVSNSRAKRFVEKFLDSTVDKVAENAAADIVAQSIKEVLSKSANKAFGYEATASNNKKK